MWPIGEVAAGVGAVWGPSGRPVVFVTEVRVVAAPSWDRGKVAVRRCQACRCSRQGCGLCVCPCVPPCAEAQGLTDIQTRDWSQEVSPFWWVVRVWLGLGRCVQDSGGRMRLMPWLGLRSHSLTHLTR